MTQQATNLSEPATAHAPSLLLLRAVADTLDSLGIAVCVFDDADHTLLWNPSFLKFFPEHAGHVHAGEPYRANLRRFYQGRLAADELPKIDQYIDSGLARHRTQERPYAFEHLGVRLWVGSLPLPGVGRIRIWQAHTSATDPQGPTILATSAIDGAALFDYVADGVMVTGADDRILWANAPFVQLYGLPNRTAAIGAHLEWVTAPPGRAGRRRTPRCSRRAC